MFVCELLSGLWVGSPEILQNKNFLVDNDITIIFNCTQLYNFPENPDIQKIRLPFPPSEDTKCIEIMKINKDKIIDHIHNHIDTHNILIVCYNGKTISPLIVALYILKYGKLNKKSIYEILLSKDPQLSLWCDLDIFN